MTISCRYQIDIGFVIAYAAMYHWMHVDKTTIVCQCLMNSTSMKVTSLFSRQLTGNKKNIVVRSENDQRSC